MMFRYIITIAGGIGNQMIQYSLYMYLKKQSIKCLLVKKPEELNINHGVDIDSFFSNIKIEKDNLVLNYYIRLYEFFQKIDNIFFKFFKIKLFVQLLPIKVANFPLWTNYLFFDQIKEELISSFTFPNDINSINKRLRFEIKNSNSVSLHVRRGDYVTSLQWRPILGDICDLEYYIKALSIIEKNVVDPKYFVFSDDIGWVKGNLNLKNATYISHNLGNNSFRDIELMSLCKHNIMANSTFSLIASWLNQNKNSTIICPSKWKNTFDLDYQKKFSSPNWIQIDNSKPNISIIIKSDKISLKTIKDILDQNYSDFEILLKYSMEINFFDKRIKYLSDGINGRYIFEINDEMLKSFNNRNFLFYLLEKKLKSIP